MTKQMRLKTLCMASAFTTAWVGAASSTKAAEFDLDFTTFSGFNEPALGDADDALIATKKKATKKKATLKKAKKKATK